MSKRMEANGQETIKVHFSKLSNEKFVANAKPEVLAIERKKESDALSKIASLEEQLMSLS